MRQQLDENTVWTSYEGRRIPFKNLEDTHLANIVRFVEGRGLPGDEDIAQVLRGIAAERGLTEPFMDRAEIPYRDRQGRWCLHCLPIDDPALLDRGSSVAARDPEAS